MKPSVTIGIPTYRRPELLSRALASVAAQRYENLEVIVADNASPGSATAHVVASYQEAIPNLRYVRHDEGIGPLNNFMFLLKAAQGRYFMWLADDDEISPTYVESLADLLESDPGAASAAGHWLLMDDESGGRLMKTSSYPQRHALARAVRFVWRSDDAFFYGLHRRDVLREASFRGYLWPNRDVLLNWAYVYLLDVVLRGRVLIAPDPSVRFVNHDYTPKSYAKGRRSLWGRLSRAWRRINVHLLYWEKCSRVLSPLSLPAVAVTSSLALLREGSGIVLRRVARLVQDPVRRSST